MMDLHYTEFGYRQHTSANVRANKAGWTQAVNRLMPKNRFMQEDEP